MCSSDLVWSSMKNLTATRRLDGGESLASYGLDNPSITLTLNSVEGESTVLYVGKQASNGDFYAMLEGNDTVHTISPNLPGYLAKSLNEWYALPVIAMTGATANSAEYYSEVAGMLLDDKSIESLSENEDTTAVGTLRSAWSALAFSSLAVYEPTDVDLADCGLDTPTATVSIGYAEGSRTTVQIGAQTDSGDFYARVSYCDDVFVLPYDQVSTLLGALGAF